VICTFFGHRDCPLAVEHELRRVLWNLVEQGGADEFMVGTHGNFDRMVLGQLRKLKEAFPHIHYDVVLAYMPQHGLPDRYENTIYPEGMECVPRKFAILKRNQWMVERCDMVVSYVLYSGGGAAQFVRLAEKKGKRIINLAKKGKNKSLCAVRRGSCLIKISWWAGWQLR